jgi:hypothetical protein
VLCHKRAQVVGRSQKKKKEKRKEQVGEGGNWESPHRRPVHLQETGRKTGRARARTRAGTRPAPLQLPDKMVKKKTQCSHAHQGARAADDTPAPAEGDLGLRDLTAGGGGREGREGRGGGERECGERERRERERECGERGRWWREGGSASRRGVAGREHAKKERSGRHRLLDAPARAARVQVPPTASDPPPSPRPESGVTVHVKARENGRLCGGQEAGRGG